MKHFKLSFLITAICLGASAWWGYSNAGIGGAVTAFSIAAILGIMEVSLSFDNAVVNASVLKHWDRFWQTMFLTVGVLVAVFGMRLVFPLVIVSQAADLGMMEVWNLALSNPKVFSTHLTNHHAEVAAFGGIFLLLVFLNFLFDEEKELHWLGKFEEMLASYAHAGSIPVLVALAVVLGSVGMVDEAKKLARTHCRHLGDRGVCGRRFHQQPARKRGKRGNRQTRQYRRLPVSRSAGCVIFFRRRDRRLRHYK